MILKKHVYFFIFCGFIFFTSCKKNRICECKNSNATYDAGEINDTKYQAKKYCTGLSSGDTQCYLK
jgi:hypothetical protein